LIIFQSAKLSTRSIIVCAGAIEGCLKKKRRGNFNQGVSFLHDNAPAHRALATRKKLSHLGFQCLDRPPYYPDLALPDCHLFPGLKNN
jgi:hypothetical protein